METRKEYLERYRKWLTEQKYTDSIGEEILKIENELQTLKKQTSWQEQEQAEQ